MAGLSNYLVIIALSEGNKNGYFVNQSAKIYCMTKKNKSKKVQEEKSFKETLTSQLVTLSTSGFGLVAALAWNSAIQQAVQDLIASRIPGSGLLSKLIYALLVTILAVVVTFQLSKLAARFQNHSSS